MAKATPVSIRRRAQCLRSIIFRASVLLLATMSLLVFGALGVSRAYPLPQILDLPRQYLPGSSVPASRLVESVWYDALCCVDFHGHDLYFELDPSSAQIRRTIIPAQDYMLGQFIVAWGKPSGIKWNHYTVHVYWTTRRVILERQALWPHSQVQAVMYTLEQPPARPWTGFGRGNSIGAVSGL